MTDNQFSDLDRALGALAVDDGRPFPSPGTLRLKAALFVEQQRLARRAAMRFGFQAAAFVVCVGLFAAVFLLSGPIGSFFAVFGSAGPVCGIVVVAVSLWNLVRSVDETALTS